MQVCACAERSSSAASNRAVPRADERSCAGVQSVPPRCKLHNAAHAHAFDKLKIEQKWVDARDPIMWFHIYRGSKCASEKYASGTPPCGGSYHAAGDYTLGGFTNRDRDDGVLLESDGRSTPLWNPDAPAGVATQQSKKQEATQ